MSLNSWMRNGLICALLATGWRMPDILAQAVVTEARIHLLPGGRTQKPFDVTRHTIPLKELRDGGVPRDGIPALYHPSFLLADQAGRQLRRFDRVLGVTFSGEAKAYPVKILNWHELVNDFVGGRPILVSW